MPADDGPAAHLAGAVMRATALRSISGEPTRMDTRPGGPRRLIIYACPLTGLPTLSAQVQPHFEGGGGKMLRRLTLVVSDGAIEKGFYPVFPPGWARRRNCSPR